MFPGTPTVISTVKLGTSLIPGSTTLDNCEISHCNANTKSHFNKKRLRAKTQNDAINVSSLIMTTTRSNSNCFTTALDCWNYLSLRRLFRARARSTSWDPGPFHRGLLGLFDPGTLVPLRAIWYRVGWICFGWKVVQSTGRITMVTWTQW